MVCEIQIDLNPEREKITKTGSWIGNNDWSDWNSKNIVSSPFAVSKRQHKNTHWKDPRKKNSEGKILWGVTFFRGNKANLDFSSKWK